MANPEHVAIVRQGAEGIREWRDSNPDAVLDLVNAWLGGLICEEADLHQANMAGAHLLMASLRGSDLADASFSGAIVDLTDLRDCNMRGAHLLWTVFHEVQMCGANLDGSECLGTVFSSVDLSGSTGAGSIIHHRPSTIGIDTLFRSRGQIPDVFLRGCGVPGIMIEYMHSLTGQALEFYRCFISFNEADDAFSQRLYNDLQAKGVRCWRWKEDARWGKTLMRSVDEAIRGYDKLIVICSEHSLKAEPVIREIERALQKEQREEKDVLFPIRIDDAVFSWKHELQADVVRKCVGDFTRWNDPSSYTKALDRLIRDLKAEAPMRTE